MSAYALSFIFLTNPANIGTLQIAPLGHASPQSIPHRSSWRTLGDRMNPKKPIIPLWMLRPIVGRVVRSTALVVSSWFCFNLFVDVFIVRLPDYKWADAFTYAWLTSMLVYELVRWSLFGRSNNDR